MSNQKEYTFYYVKGILYMGLMAGLIVGWFVLAGVVEVLSRHFFVRWPAFLAPLLMLVGLVVIWWQMRRRFSVLYVRRGVGSIANNGFELRLGSKTMEIPFGDIRHLSYRDSRRGSGMILSAKGHSLYLEAPYTPVRGDIEGQQALKRFYADVRNAYENSRFKFFEQGEDPGAQI